MRKLPNLPTSALRRISRRTGLVSVAFLMLVLAGCGDRQLSTMDPESPIAEKLDTFLVILLIVCGIVFVLVQGIVLYMAKRFGVRAPEDESEIYPDEEFPEQIHGNTRLELLWTAIPTVIMAIVAVFTVQLLVQLDDVDATDNDRQRIESVTAVGQQWWWEFHYTLTDGEGPGPHIVTAGELVLPEDEEIRVWTTSRDVIHSFWVPTLNGKRDAVPGRYNSWTIEAANNDRYPGECTEFCGLSHAYMEKFVISLDTADWDTWAANQQTDAVIPDEATEPEAFAGWEVFANQCASCHVINGLTQHSDPDVADDNDIFDSFAMYNSGGGLDDNGAPKLPAWQYLDNQVQVAGAAPNLTHFATRSSFAGGIFELYEQSDPTWFQTSEHYLTIAESGDLNRGPLEAWIVNAPEEKANAWDSPSGQRGMTPFVGQLSAEQVDNLVAFLMTLDES